MVRYTIRMSDELHDRLRWLAFSERRSEHSSILEVLEKRLKDVKLPKEAKR